jgi:rubrerythrin
MRADQYSFDGRIRLGTDVIYASAAKLEELFMTGTIGSALDSYSRQREFERFSHFHTKADAATAAHEAYVTVSKEYKGWTRFFLVPDGHIHSSMECSTCNRGGKATEFRWLPDLSGLSESDAVAAHGPWLCTVCYPSAPVEYTNGKELKEAAAHADRCAGSGTYVTSTKTSRATCPVCGASVRLSANSRIFVHDRKA